MPTGHVAGNSLAGSPVLKQLQERDCKSEARSRMQAISLYLMARSRSDILFTCVSAIVTDILQLPSFMQIPDELFLCQRYSRV